MLSHGPTVQEHYLIHDYVAIHIEHLFDPADFGAGRVTTVLTIHNSTVIQYLHPIESPSVQPVHLHQKAPKGIFPHPEIAPSGFRHAEIRHVLSLSTSFLPPNP